MKFIKKDLLIKIILLYFAITHKYRFIFMLNKKLSSIFNLFITTQLNSIDYYMMITLNKEMKLIDLKSLTT